MRLREEALEYHRIHHGKIEVTSRVPLRDQQDLSLAYTPGVAEPCKQIQIEPESIFDYTNRGNLVAILTDGSAVLGLGDIGPGAGLPVMEGKAVLFKAFGGVDAFPVLVNTQDVDKIVEVMKLLEPGFGGVNVEDVSAPRCFELERRLKEELDIPVFHDDQHGTAIVVGAAFLNALRVVQKKIEDVRVVFNGAGASGIMVSRMLRDLGVKDIILCDRQGTIYQGRPGLNPEKEVVAKETNPRGVKGSLADALVGADAFVGLSSAGAVTMDMIRPMNKDGIVFALANPVPEIWPVQAVEVGAAVVGTGRSDFANQINNVLGFPGVFRGALDVRARRITEGMKQAAARAIAGLITDQELRPDYVIPAPLDRRVAPAVARAVAEQAIKEGLARRVLDPAEVEQHCIELTREKEGQA
jgi:malate dehydrogenase (oxaloacetate-decarboxylating)